MAGDLTVRFVTESSAAAGGGGGGGTGGGGDGGGKPISPATRPPGTIGEVLAKEFKLDPGTLKDLTRLLPGGNFLGKMLGQAAPGVGPGMQAITGGGMAGLANAGIAAAGGPVGAALMVADQVKQFMVGTVQKVGDGLQTIARLDTGGLANGFEAVAGKLGPLGEVVGSASQAFRGFINALDQTAARLAPFSGELSIAQARADMAQTMGDIRRAERLGPGLADFTEARSRLEQTGQDMLARLLEPLIPMATQILRLLELGMVPLEMIAEFAAKVFEYLGQVGEQVQRDLERLPVIGDAVQAITAYLRRNDEEKHIEIFDALMRLSTGTDFGMGGSLESSARRTAGMMAGQPATAFGGF